MNVVAGPAVRDIQRLPEKYATAIVEVVAHSAEDPRRLGKPLRLELRSWAGGTLFQLAARLAYQRRRITQLGLTCAQRSGTLQRCGGSVACRALVIRC